MFLDSVVLKTNSTPIVLAISLAISMPMLTATVSTGQTATAQNQSQGQSTAPLNFYLKLNNNQTTSQAASQAASNGTGTKNMTITVNVQKGSGNPIKLPISAVVPNNINPQDLQLCASLSSGQQMCQPLGQNAANIDLSSATAKTTPQAYQENKAGILDISLGSLVQYADAQLISVNNTTLNIPITVIVPITLEIQNAQICATVASSGDQSCQQIVLNPTQSAFTPVNVDLANPTTPTVTTLSAAVPTTQQLTGSPAGTNNTSGAAGTNNTSSGTSGSNATSGTSSGTGNNNTSDNTGTSSDQSSNPTTSQQPTSKPPQDNTATKDKNQDKKDNTGSSNNGNSGN
jgi:hypothetical protein